jgi:hypothetical protein
MESSDENKDAIKQIQNMLNGDKPKKEKKSFFSRKKKAAKEETKVQIKTILDIPPLAKVRRSIGNKDLVKAAKDGKDEVQKDIERYFNISLAGNQPTLAIIYNMIRNKYPAIPEDVMVDPISFSLQTISIGSDEKDTEQMKMITLKKFASFLIDVYEPALFSNDFDVEGDKILNTLIDIYNYMDIKKLYFVD